MKTKITSFLTFAVASLLTLSSTAFADAESGFYESDHVRGFISIGADYRGMRSEFHDYVNNIAFRNGYHMEEVTVSDGEESRVDTLAFAGSFKYSKFNSYYLGLHVNLGAQYKQFLTWFDFNFMPPQISERPSKTYSASAAIEDADGNVVEVVTKKYPLYNVEWYSYGIDWMFGWKLFGENTIINLIPSVGFGLNLINFHFASNFDLVYMENPSKWDTMRDRDYSTIATTFNSELELRLEFSRIAIGAYGGYRFIRYNELKIESRTMSNTVPYQNTDAIGDTWFAGLRLTWLFLSDWQKKQRDRL
ncbi:MAG: hypothetical protein II892_00220 [Fibrobacter sp.]|jgi:hypothetical protein|nr:hypothetical protein [Fibrobacter sp.]